MLLVLTFIVFTINSLLLKNDVMFFPILNPRFKAFDWKKNTSRLIAAYTYLKIKLCFGFLEVARALKREFPTLNPFSAPPACG